MKTLAKTSTLIGITFWLLFVSWFLTVPNANAALYLDSKMPFGMSSYQGTNAGVTSQTTSLLYISTTTLQTIDALDKKIVGFMSCISATCRNIFGTSGITISQGTTTPSFQYSADSNFHLFDFDYDPQGRHITITMPSQSISRLTTHDSAQPICRTTNCSTGSTGARLILADKVDTLYSFNLNGDMGTTTTYVIPDDETKLMFGLLAGLFLVLILLYAWRVS